MQYSHRCLWLVLATIAWFAFGAYWYPCVIRQICDQVPVGATPPTPLTATTTVETPTTTTEAPSEVRTWEHLREKPLTVYFKVNSNTVSTEEVESILKDIVSYLRNDPAAKISIAGHTNHDPDEVYTQALGLARAEKVKELLVSYGARPDQITTLSKGSSETVAPDTDEESNLNRRAVISIVE
jgi:outer membrane protein OmpA-like peptidoglycan-associated protein